MTKCNWCGSPGACVSGCLCEKCINPTNYNNNWKFNNDGTFTEKYKNWRIKEKIKYLEKEIETLKLENQGTKRVAQYFESMIGYTDNLERCPICKHEDDNTHIIQTIVAGCTTFVLDGVDAKQVFDKEGVCKNTSRGTNVFIYFYSEHCDHVWCKNTWFHKGETRTDVTILDEFELKELGWIKTINDGVIEKFNIPESWRN